MYMHIHVFTILALYLIIFIAGCCCRSHRQLEKDLDNVRRAEKVSKLGLMIDYKPGSGYWLFCLSLYLLFPHSQRMEVKS